MTRRILRVCRSRLRHNVEQRYLKNNGLEPAKEWGDLADAKYMVMLACRRLADLVLHT